jgi:hypothetical protein
MALIYLTTTAEESSWNPYALANFNRVLKSSKHSVECRHYIESIQQGHFTRFWKELIRGKLGKN